MSLKGISATANLATMIAHVTKLSATLGRDIYPAYARIENRQIHPVPKRRVFPKHGCKLDRLAALPLIDPFLTRQKSSMAQPSPNDAVLVEFRSSQGGLLPGWEVGDKTAPAVMLIQEWWGVTDIVKMQATMVAARGYRAFVPDLYTHTKLYQETGRTVAFDREEAGHSMNTLDFKLAVEEIGAAAAYLKQTGSPCVGIMGGCMGGALAFAAAEKVPGLCAAVPFYGTLEPFLWKLPRSHRDPQPFFQVEHIKIPVQYHTGELDNIKGFSDVATGRAVVERMRAAGCEVEMFTYPDTPHSFLNALVPGGMEFLDKWDYGVPHQEQVHLAFERTMAFFDKHCKSCGRGQAS